MADEIDIGALRKAKDVAQQRYQQFALRKARGAYGTDGEMRRLQGEAVATEKALTEATQRAAGAASGSAEA